MKSQSGSKIIHRQYTGYLNKAGFLSVAEPLGIFLKYFPNAEDNRIVERQT
jgi:hypothetical protein